MSFVSEKTDSELNHQFREPGSSMARRLLAWAPPRARIAGRRDSSQIFFPMMTSFHNYHDVTRGRLWKFIRYNSTLLKYKKNSTIL